MAYQAGLNLPGLTPSSPIAVALGGAPRNRATRPNLSPKQMPVAKLTVDNPLRAGTMSYMGRHKAERMQKAGKLTISPCGTRVHLTEDAHRRVLEYNTAMRDLRQQIGYDTASDSGVISRAEMRSVPLIGPDAYQKLIRLTKGVRGVAHCE